MSAKVTKLRGGEAADHGIPPEQVRTSILHMREKLVELAIHVAALDSGENSDSAARIVCDAFASLNRMSTDLLDTFLPHIDHRGAESAE